MVTDRIRDLGLEAYAASPPMDSPDPTPPTDENVSPRTHPEHFCQRCGGPNLMCWHAPSPLWNTVMRDAEGLEKLSIVCPRCFGELAREAGVADYFCLTTHDAKVPLPAVFGDGRVWNAEKCRWVEREASSPATPALDVERLRAFVEQMAWYPCEKGEAEAESAWCNPCVARHVLNMLPIPNTCYDRTFAEAAR